MTVYLTFIGSNNPYPVLVCSDLYNKAVSNIIHFMITDLGLPPGLAE